MTTTAALNAKVNEVKNEILSITNVATNASVNAKINEVKNKIPNITNLATNTAFTVENKILYQSKYITTVEFNQLTAEHLAARLVRANLTNKI